MKKIIIFIMLLIFSCVLCSQTDKERYYEIGPNLGIIKRNPIHNRKDIPDYLRESYVSANEKYRIDYGGKTGISFYDNFIITLEYYHYSRTMSGKNMGFSNFYADYDGSLTLHYLAPGIVYYPNKYIQLSASSGFDLCYIGDIYQVGGCGGLGLTFSLSVAYEIQCFKNHGLLLGVNYLNTYYDIVELSNNPGNKNFDTNNLNVFIKYRYWNNKK